MLLLLIFCRFVNPITYGDYPESMRALVGNRLPNFTEAQSKMVKESLDFLGVNYYTARYADDSMSSSSVNLSYSTDSHVDLTSRFKKLQPSRRKNLAKFYIWSPNFDVCLRILFVVFTSFDRWKILT